MLFRSPRRARGSVLGTLVNTPLKRAGRSAGSLAPSCHLSGDSGSSLKAVQDPSPSVRPAELCSSTEDNGPVTVHGALTTSRALLTHRHADPGRWPLFRSQATGERRGATSDLPPSRPAPPAAPGSGGLPAGLAPAGRPACSQPSRHLFRRIC